MMEEDNMTGKLDDFRLTFSFARDVKEAVKTTANDYDLGNKVRELSNAFENKMQKFRDAQN